MANKRVLAFDFGASSGRALIATFDGKTISMEEIHRFSNDPVKINGVLYWDVLRLFFEIKQGITKATNAGGFDAIGIDTWGVDFGLLDKNGNLLANPRHYRDEHTVGIMEEVFGILGKDTLYARTGIQFMRFNTIFQLYSLLKKEPDLMSRAETMLLMPDLFAYLLTGEKKAEYTEVSTTQMLDPKTGDWAYDLIEKLGIPKKILPEIIDAGSTYGMLSEDICKELGCKSVPVIAVATHDTGSAVVSVPASVDDFIYISCGTWSLFGTESKVPIMNEKSFELNITNEGGYGRTTRFLKNIIGLWVIQESRRQYIREGQEVSFADLERDALAVEPLKCFIDPDNPAFEVPGNLPLEVQKFCERTGQYVPQTRGEIMRCIYESLAMKYRYAFESIKDVTGKDYSFIHMIGGGTKDKLLCQMTANSCNTQVMAGPIEATGTGNVAVQLMALGEIKDLKEARKIIADSLDPLFYNPTDEVAAYDAAYPRFMEILGK